MNKETACRLLQWGCADMGFHQLDLTDEELKLVPDLVANLGAAYCRHMQKELELTKAELRFEEGELRWARGGTSDLFTGTNSLDESDLGLFADWVESSSEFGLSRPLPCHYLVPDMIYRLVVRFNHASVQRSRPVIEYFACIYACQLLMIVAKVGPLWQMRGVWPKTPVFHGSTLVQASYNFMQKAVLLAKGGTWAGFSHPNPGQWEAYLDEWRTLMLKVYNDRGLRRERAKKRKER